jgi:transposase
MDDQRDDPKPEAPRRIEILTGDGVRRRWSAALKAKIVAESFAPGAVVAELARRHGTRSSQIHLWRKQAREGRLALPAASVGAFAEVVVTTPAAPIAPRTTGAPIEITVDRIHVRVRDGADAALVHALVRALKS